MCFEEHMTLLVTGTVSISIPHCDHHSLLMYHSWILMSARKHDALQPRGVAVGVEFRSNSTVCCGVDT